MSCRSTFVMSSGDVTNRARSSVVRERVGTVRPGWMVLESGAAAALPERVPAAGPPAVGPPVAVPVPVD
eukprot:5183875-Pleurochrysis_carterae.AAC.2